MIVDYNNVYIIGPMPISHITTALLDQSFCIFVDGGFNHYPQLRAKNYAVVGDSDSASIPSESFDYLKSPMKDQTDFEMAFVYLEGILATNKTDASQVTVQLLGLFGGRMDHYLSILGELFRQINFYQKLILRNHDQSFEFFKAGLHQINYQGAFSIISFENCTVSLLGDIQYPVVKEDYIALSGKYLSNVSSGEFQIQVNATFAIFYFNDC